MAYCFVLSSVSRVGYGDWSKRDRVNPFDDSTHKELRDTYVDVWESFPRDDQFNLIMMEADDSVFILRAHLLIELRLLELLGLRFPNAEVLWPRNFEPKITALHKAKVFETDYSHGLKGVNWLRNQFAHPPIKFDFSNEMLETIRNEFMRGSIAYNMGSFATAVPNDVVTPSGLLRAFTSIVYYRASDLVEALNSSAKPEDRAFPED